ncbi:MAG: hypothetical protein AB2689_08680 [Candidatus Thiodiazotropha taylori]
MNSKVKVIPKGSVFIVTLGGEDAGCLVIKMCQAIKDIYEDVLLEEYQNELHNSLKERYQRCRDNKEVITWMIDEKRYAAEISCYELNLGYICEIDLEITPLFMPFEITAK